MIKSPIRYSTSSAQKRRKKASKKVQYWKNKSTPVKTEVGELREDDFNTLPEIPRTKKTRTSRVIDRFDIDFVGPTNRSHDTNGPNNVQVPPVIGASTMNIGATREEPRPPPRPSSDTMEFPPIKVGNPRKMRLSSRVKSAKLRMDGAHMSRPVVSLDFGLDFGDLGDEEENEILMNCDVGNSRRMVGVSQYNRSKKPIQDHPTNTTTHTHSQNHKRTITKHPLQPTKTQTINESPSNDFFFRPFNDMKQRFHSCLFK